MLWILLIVQIVTLIVVAWMRYDQRQHARAPVVPLPASKVETLSSRATSPPASRAEALAMLNTGQGRELLRRRIYERIAEASAK